MKKTEMAARLAKIEAANSTITPDFITEAEARFLALHYPQLVIGFFDGTVSRDELTQTVTESRELREQLQPHADRNYPGYS